MSSINLSKLSAAELKDLAEKASALATKLEKRDGELASLVQKLVQDAEALGFTLSDIKAVLIEGGSKKRGSSAATKAKDYVEGVVYKSADGKQTWTGGTKGPKPGWLRALLDSGKTFAQLASK